MFERLEVNGEEIPAGQSVRIIRDQSSWLVQPASVDAYLIAAIIIMVGVALGFVVA